MDREARQGFLGAPWRRGLPNSLRWQHGPVEDLADNHDLDDLAGCIVVVTESLVASARPD